MKFISIISGIGGHDCYLAGICPLSGTHVVPMGYLRPARGFAIHIHSDDEGRRRVSNLREHAPVVRAALPDRAGQMSTA